MNMKRFREPIVAATPVNTKYSTKWSLRIFKEWQSTRANTSPALESTALNFGDKSKLQDLNHELEEFNAESLNFWLTKFVQEVTKKNGEPYPPRSIYLIMCGLNRDLLKNKPLDAINILDKSELRMAQFRRTLNAEMKEGGKKGLEIKSKKKEREEITDEEEEILWSTGLLGSSTAESLMHTIYYLNGKLFGLRASEHRKLRFNNIRVENNYVIFDESLSKTFHGGVSDLKHKARVVRHFCHDLRQAAHTRCLVNLYTIYLYKIQPLAKKCESFYFKPHRNPSMFTYELLPVGINSLNKILPEKLCVRAGLKRKTSHSLRITCATKLFQSGIEEKIIRERTGHRSDSLFRYERPAINQLEKASVALAPVNSKSPQSNEFSTFEFDILEDVGIGKSVSTKKEALEIPDDILSRISLPSSAEESGIFDFDVSDEFLSQIDLDRYCPVQSTSSSTCKTVMTSFQ